MQPGFSDDLELPNLERVEFETGPKVNPRAASAFADTLLQLYTIEDYLVRITLR